MKKVSFVFAPFLASVTKHPYLSMELLTTILKKNGFECEKFDLNLDINRKFYDLNVYGDIISEMEKSKDRNIHSVISANNFRINHENIDSLPEWIWSGVHSKIENYFCKKPLNLEELFEKGIDLHPTFDRILNNYVDDLINSKSDVIAFSVAFGEQLPYALYLIDKIKEKEPSLPVIMGGAQISLLEKSQIKSIKENSSVDLVFQGYAEEQIVNVIEKLSVCRDEPMVISGGALTRASLKNLPFSDFDYDVKYNGNNTYPILVTKGCYWGKCAFCDYVLMGDLGDDRYIARPVEEAYAEMKHIRTKDPNATFILISDAVPPNWYKKLAKMANAENFKLNSYSYMINNKAINDEFFREISQAGVLSFTFGTESTSDRVLNLMAKQANRQDIINNLELASKYNVRVKINLIPNYPSTTYAEALDAYKVIKKYKDTIHIIAIFKFYLSANTNMFQNPQEFGLEIKDAPYLKSDHNGYHTVSYEETGGGMTTAEENKIYFLFYSLAKEIKHNSEQKLVEHFYNKNQFENIYFKSSYQVVKVGDEEYLTDTTTNKRILIDDDVKEIIDKAYGENLVPLYNNLQDFLENNQTDQEDTEKFIKKKFLVA